MPISRDEAAKKFEENNESQLQAIYDRIDKAAIRAGGGLFTVAADLIPTNLKSQVVNKYLSLGWAVEHHSDQRDGNYYEFS
jgi:hypothetical protein